MPDSTRPREAEVISRGVLPTPDVVKLESHRPGTRNYSTGPAGNDNTLCRPLGYRCKGVTLQAPDSTYKTGANSDSIYVDVEDVSIPSTGGIYATPAANNAPLELPAGASLTIEEVDPGWIHFASPTANQRLMVSWGGPSRHKE